MTYRRLLFVAMLTAVAALAACNNSQSAAQVAHDTATAQQAAADSAAKTQQKADARIASARADVRDEQRDLAHVGAVEEQRVADAQADGDYKVALARCGALSGAPLQSCKDQASADRDVARARAEQAKAATDPKP